LAVVALALKAMSSWGSHILHHLSLLPPVLAAGCTSAPPPEPAAPLPPPPPPITSAPEPPKPPEFKPDPPDARAGLSEFRPLVAASATGMIALRDEQLVAFGKGVITHGRLTPPSGYAQPPCLMGGLTRERCAFFRVASWVRPPVGLGYFGAIQESAVGTWSPLRPSPAPWVTLSPGREVAYAIRNTPGLTIDTIDEKGEIKTIFDASSTPELGSPRVVELPQKLVIVGAESNENELQVYLLKRDGEGKFQLTPGPSTGVYLLPPGATAAWARGMIAARKRVGYGLWAAAPSLDAKGEPEDAFYLAWTEVIPPAKYTPAGVAPKKRSAKNGCGRSSRPLSDLSVEKKVHVMKFNGDGKRTEDRILPGISFSPEDEDLALTLVPTSYGYMLNGALHGRDGRPKGDTAGDARHAEGLAASPPIPAPPFQRILSAAYDQKQGEGLILIAEENHQVALRFDATGGLLGNPIPLENSLQNPTINASLFAMAGASWGALERNATGVQAITGPQAGKVIPLRSEQSWSFQGGRAWILPLDDAQLQVVRYVTLTPAARTSFGIDENERAPVFMPLMAQVNLSTGESTPWQAAPGWLDGEKKPRLRDVSWVGRGASGQLLFFGSNEKGQRELHQLSGDEWAKPTPIGDGAESSAAHVLHVWKDHTILLDDSNSIATWLNKGLTVQIGKRFGHSVYNRNPGPLLAPGEFLMTGEASPPVKIDPAMKPLYGTCPASFATGPQRVVLVCSEPPDGKTPGARVGTRVLRF
jgi:hypothetical protein